MSAKVLQWRWKWRDAASAARFGAHPEDKTPDTCLVKSNPVRAVFRRQNCFFKLELADTRHIFKAWRNLFFPKSRSEYRAALALEKAAVPVVRVLGYGQAGGNSMLISEEFTGGESVTSYWCRKFVRRAGDPEKFLQEYAIFLKKIFQSGFYHPDLHGGNILYRAATHEFVLVDVYGVRRGKSNSRRMARIITELGERLTPSELGSFAVQCGLAADREQGEHLYAQLLAAERRRLQKELPRRLKQFFNDYPKYIAKEKWHGKTIRFTLDAAGTPWTTTAELDCGKFTALTVDAPEFTRMRAADFTQNMLLEPHRRIVACDVDGGIIYMQKD